MVQKRGKARVTVRTTRKRASTNKSAKELTRLGAALRALGGLGGSMAGGLLGHPAAGGTLGTQLGASLSKWLGSGDYTVRANSIIDRTARGSDSIPNMHKDGQTITVRHKEYLGPVRGNTGFAVQYELNLNPGLERAFPWLSRIAGNFQQYVFKGVVFHYVPTSGHAINGTNPALGSVMLQTSYRSNDSSPVSKVEMMNEYWACEASPTEAFCHPIECDPREGPFQCQYVRTGDVPAGDNTLLYDLGRTVVAVSGQQANDNVLGDLWVTYEVELRKPVVASNVTSPDNWALSTHSTNISATTSWFGDVHTSSGTLPATYQGNTLTFPPGVTGTYLVSVYMIGAITAADFTGNPVLTNATNYKVDEAGTAYYRSIFTAAAGSTSRPYYTRAFTLTDPSVASTVTFPSVSVTGTIATTNVTIVQMF